MQRRMLVNCHRMIFFFKKLHVSLPNDLKGQCRTTEAPDFLFKVDPEAELVEPKKQE